MKYRKWQAEALEKLNTAPRGAVVQAVMGAGKSIVIAELVRAYFHRGYTITVTAPTQMLVQQLAETIRQHAKAYVGEFYANEKRAAQITVVCHASLKAYEECVSPEERRMWIADECHSTECDTVIGWASAIEWTASVGFTATPFRSESSQSISLFDELIYRYSAADAHQDGHVVKPTVEHSEDDDADMSALKWVKDQILLKRPRIVANSRSIDDCEEFATLLRSHEIDALCVHSKSDAGYVEAKRAIRSGSHVVCYVNMLAEGFNAPEIQAMVLRRPVGSRVRFAQEVGRGLRACAAINKTTCYQFDIHDLWEHHTLKFEESLGEIDDRVPALVLFEAMQKRRAEADSEEARLKAEVLGPIRSWLRNELIQAQFDREDSVIPTGSWRRDPPTRKQLDLIDNMMKRLGPARLGENAKFVMFTRQELAHEIASDGDELPTDFSWGAEKPEARRAITKGDASDLITFLKMAEK